MKVFLDTHVIVWTGLASNHLSAKARMVLQEASEIYVSAASAWEIAMKVRLGKWPEAVNLEADFMKKMKSAGFQVLPVTAPEALRAGRLPGDHGDPFDRMIAAQALSLDISILSIDSKLDQFGVRRFW